ncbi:MAG: epoxyqueuosine reductase QueH [Solobacterium sp.]|nr:epoxyqueuosine reductase QueH [Solobacterium sp.]
MNEREEYLAYWKARKQENKPNYYLRGEEELERIRTEFTDRKPRILMHACCAVCAGWPVTYLRDFFDITLYYGNSNIWPESEYERRLNELKRLIHEAWDDTVELVIPPYDNPSFTEMLAPRKDDPEGWKRCFLCYEKRMDDAYAYASEHQFDYFTTVMTISRQKDSQKLNEIGAQLSEKYPGVRYFYSDFKKKDGQLRRNEIMAQYDLYNQNYCGCIFSLRNNEKAQ